jgi:putative hemolysin
MQDSISLADRPICSITTPRPEVAWIDLDGTRESMLASIRSSPHAQLLASRGSIDKVVGVVRKEDLLSFCLDDKALDIEAVIRVPKLVHEAISILNTLELFKLTPVHMAIVVDEHRVVQGVVTQTDLLEAIAGDLPQAAERNQPLPHDHGGD